MQSIKVYHAPHGRGPNPWKVDIVLEELGLPYDIIWIPYGKTKSEPYTLLNPNGRVPSMIDQNKDVTLWESGAIINYLIATYDTELKLTYGDDRLEDKWLLQSWLMFQMSAQGPMFGQKVWFTYFHVEQNLKSVIDRYGNEAKRIIGVVEGALSKQRQKLGLGAEDVVWLVGDKCTYADLAFVSWNLSLDAMFPGGGLDLKQEFPEYHRWLTNATRRPATKKVLEHREECIQMLKDSTPDVLERQADGIKIQEYESSIGVGGS
ncbi:glutathione transferase [Hypoxylon sp. FL1284]|nr:glutathione transferase [Hypoxylon sp. FL1284]